MATVIHSDNHPGDNLDGTSTSAAATVNHASGTITTESLTTGAGSVYSFALTNSLITTDSVVVASVSTAGAGQPCVASVTPAAGSATIKIQNIHASNAFNNTLTIAFFVVT